MPIPKDTKIVKPKPEIKTPVKSKPKTQLFEEKEFNLVEAPVFELPPEEPIQEENQAQNPPIDEPKIEPEV